MSGNTVRYGYYTACGALVFLVSHMDHALSSLAVMVLGWLILSALFVVILTAVESKP